MIEKDLSQNTLEPEVLGPVKKIMYAPFTTHETVSQE
jgi:hypothetical protein